MFPQESTVEDRDDSKEAALENLTRHHRAIAESPLVKHPFLHIGLPISIAILLGCGAIAAMLFLLGLPSPW